MKKTALRVEKSQNTSGVLLQMTKIPVLREDDYYVLDVGLDGDAPKQFIKAYFFEPDSGVRKSRPKTWIPFIAKSAEKWYPHESVIEFMINKIGIALGLNMNGVKLAMANGQIRFLSRYFLGTNDVLVHGAEICGEYLDDHEMAAEIANNRRTSRELFTFEFICKAIDYVFPEACEELVLDLVKMITFDAIVGNNDRHFYNWGVVNSAKKGRKRPKFAPIYDSARGLLWNESEANLYRHHANKWSGKKIVNYIKDAMPRISIENDAGVNHFQLIEFIRSRSRDFSNIVSDLVSKQKEGLVLHMLERDIFRHFSIERRELVSQILRERFRILRDLI